jgi:cobalamin-dependent methionine synthase I
LPGVFTSLGVSNVSFGLAPEARAVLNSVFLHHCVEAGLDMAIVNPAHVQPYAEIPAGERALSDDLVFNRRPDALQRFIEHYESRGGTSARAGRGRGSDGVDDAEQRVHWMVVHRKKDGIEAALDAAGVREHPVRVLNEVLLPAMKEVGDKFGAGELILPFVLQSAEVMKKAVKHLEQFLERAEGFTKGRVVLATVYGDVHDIGKSLVNTILSNNGYTVYDLGKQVPVNTIIDKAVEVGADAIGLSALLVSTSKQMPLCVQELDKRDLKFPVLIGGAAINRRFGRRALFVEASARTTRASSTARTRSKGWRRWTAPGRRRPRAVHRESSTTRATTSSCTRRSARTSRRARAAAQRSDVPRTTRSRARRSSACGRSTTFRSTRCSRCSISTSCIAAVGRPRLGPGVRQMVRTNSDRRSSVSRRGEARGVAQAARRVRLLPCPDVGKHPPRF